MYNNKNSKNILIDKSQDLMLNIGTSYLQETNCYRLSLGKRFVFISNEFAKFILEYSTFSAEDVSKFFNIPMDESLLLLLNSLCFKKILVCV